MKLRDCPFCADNEELRVCQPPHMHGYWVVHCGSCGGEMQAETEAGAIAGWNERAQLDLYEAALRDLAEGLFVIADGEGEAQVIARQTLEAAGLPTPDQAPSRRAGQ